MDIPRPSTFVRKNDEEDVAAALEASRGESRAASAQRPTLSESMAAAIARSARERIEITNLDLAGQVVVTEAATGAYSITSAAAAAAGGEVFAISADTQYGTATEAVADVKLVAANLGVDPDAIQFTDDRTALPLERATLVTNSGLVRPIDASFIGRLPESAVVALMYEAWEARAEDIDYASAQKRGVEVIAVNEHHPACAAFEFVGDLALYGLRERQWPVRGAHIVLFSDNLFADPVMNSLEANGARVTVSNASSPSGEGADLVIVAVSPPSSATGSINPVELSKRIVSTGAYGCVQLWGDLDRALLDQADIAVTPAIEPPLGHQGIPMNAAGFEAVVRLQVGGMAAAIHRTEPPESFLHGLAERVEPPNGRTR